MVIARVSLRLETDSFLGAVGARLGVGVVDDPLPDGPVERRPHHLRLQKLGVVLLPTLPDPCFDNQIPTIRRQKNDKVAKFHLHSSSSRSYKVVQFQANHKASNLKFIERDKANI